MSNKKAKLKDPQILRIFVSSPFSGMELERDCLAKLYWPRLKSVLISKGVLLRIVDLRWGITSAMSSDHQTITTCLREIDRSDIFVGLYGQRYGWSGLEDKELQKDFDRATERFPWVEEYRNKSITELEFLHGHLNNPGCSTSCFAFRSAEFDKKMSAKGKAEGIRKMEQSYKSENEETQKLLQGLKDRVAETQEDTLGVRVDYATPEEGADFIYHCVRKHIEEEIFTHQEPVSKWEKSQQAHNIYLTSRGGIYIGGEKYAEELNRYVSQEGTTPPMVITGPTGCGKTALLSNWLEGRRHADQNDIVISHFVGADPKSAKPVNLVQRIIGNLEEQLNGKVHKEYGQKIAPENLSSRLQETFDGIEDEKYVGRKLIIIVDRVDELDTQKNLKLLFWLPNELPKNVRLILTVTTGSGIAGRTLESLVTQHKSLTMEIEPLTDKSKRVLCTKILEQYSKSFEKEQQEMIFNSPKTNQPFFMRILITELCVLGKFRTLSTQIQELLECENVVELLCTVLKRIEGEYNHPDYNGSLMQDVTIAISLSKRGISELEFPMPEVLWTPLIYAMEKYLTNRSGLLSFSFPEMRMAVRKLYMPDEKTKTESAGKVSEIFYQPFEECTRTNSPVPKRIAIELPHLLAEAGDHKRLLEVISNIKVFEMLYNSTPFALNDYWQALGVPGDVIARRYLLSLDSYVATRYALHQKNIHPEAVEDLMNWKAKILLDIRKWMETSRLYTGMEVIFDREISLLSRIVGKSDIEHIHSLYLVKFDKACFLSNTGRYQESLELHQEVLQMGDTLVAVKFLKKQENAKCYNALGRCCYKLMKLEDAENWFSLAEKTMMGDLSQRAHLAWVYYNLGMTSDDKEDLKTAMDYFLKGVKLWEEIEPHSLSLGSAVNYLHIGSLYRKQGDFDNAEVFINKALSVNKTLLGNESIDVAKCLTSLSLLEHQKKNHWKSLDLLRQSLHIFRTVAPEGYHRTLFAEEMMVKQLLSVDKLDEAAPLVEDLVKRLVNTTSVSSQPQIYVEFFEKCIQDGEYMKVVDLAKQLLHTPNESDLLVSLLLNAYLKLPGGNEVKKQYSAILEYGLSKWPESEKILHVKA